MARCNYHSRGLVDRSERDYCRPSGGLEAEKEVTEEIWRIV
jgi:hypothetical protein